jgi:hypothetical protein
MIKPSLIERLIDFLAKTIAALVCLVATVWFFSLNRGSGGGREIIYISLLVIPVTVCVAYYVIALALRRLFCVLKLRRSGTPSSEELKVLANRVVKEKLALERKHPDAREQLRLKESALALVVDRAQTLRSEETMNRQEKCEEAKKLVDELIQLRPIEQNTPIAAYPEAPPSALNQVGGKK